METKRATSPNVFISYSHDFPRHIDRVLALADRLRAEGIDCHIDQYETSPPEGWPRWTVNQIERANFILIVCTEKYRSRFSGTSTDQKGLGAKWEGAIITEEIYHVESNNSKFIPIVLSSEDIAHIPISLRSATYYDLSLDIGYEKLYRRLSNQPTISKPNLGQIRPMPPLKRKQNFLNAPTVTSSSIDARSADSIHDHNWKGRPTEISVRQAHGASRLRGSWIFGSLLLLFFVLVFSFGPESLPEYKTRILTLMSALIAGLFGFFLTGDIALEVKGPQSRFGSVGIKAAGGIALFVLTIIWWISPAAPVKSAPTAIPIENYRIRITALDLQKRPIEDAVIWSSPKGDVNKVSGVWEIVIPSAALPPDKKITISIKTESPPLFRQFDLPLANDSVVATNVQLERDRSSDVHGLVVDENDRPVPDAIVKVQEHIGEPTKTDHNGVFKFPPSWGRNEQVHLSIEKIGFKTIKEYPHLAGDEPAYVILKKR